MTTIQIVAAATAITGLSAASITNWLDADALKDSVERGLPLVQPAPNFVSNLGAPVIDSFGDWSVAKKTLTYNLNWRCLFAEVGDERGNMDIWQGMATALGEIIDAVSQNTLATTINIDWGGLGAWGLVEDPAGTQFHGFDFSVTVTEFIN